MDYDRSDRGTTEIVYSMAQRPTRILHTMIRVSNLQRSLDFYIGALGMQLLRRQDYPTGRFTLAFLGYDEEKGSALELTHNWDQSEPQSVGTAYGHMAVAVEDIYASCADLVECGVKIVRAPGPMKFSPTLIAFVEDPDGYKIELIQRS
jgi:lactoylglutathione lyase